MQELEKIKEYRDKLVENCSKVIVGKENVIELVLVCFMCSGHVLLEATKKGALRTILSIKMTYKGITRITSMCIDVEQSRQILIKVVIMPESILL